MSDKNLIDSAPDTENRRSRDFSLVGMFSVCVSLIVLPLYSPQALSPLLVSELGLFSTAAGTFSMLSLTGYAMGLLLLVPLADVIENRRLVCVILLVGCISLGLAATASTTGFFCIMTFTIGACCSGIQILVPMAARRSSEDKRGNVIGTVMSGLMFGILCSRPLASITAQHFGWRIVYLLYSALFGFCAVALRMYLPKQKPAVTSTYWYLIGSMWSLAKSESILRRRALSQALCMSAFSLFWTAVPFRLQNPPFTLGGDGIGLFALAGAAGVIIAPLAGRVGDSGKTFAGTRAAHLAIIAAAALAAISGGCATLLHKYPLVALVGMAGAAFILDLGVIGDQTLGRRLVNLINPAATSRLNGLYTGLFFIGGAVGAAFSGPLYTSFGWNGICATSAISASAALLLNRRGAVRDRA